VAPLLAPVTFDIEKVHLGAADESGDELVDRAVIEFEGRSDLFPLRPCRSTTILSASVMAST